MPRETIDAAELLLDRELPVLDKGFVRLVDYMGGDARIVQSARVSYGAGTKSYRQDRGLIHYLLRNDHTSPFEQVVLTFHLKMPVFVARQWVRHRTARMNEISGRYSVLKEEMYLPEPEHIRPQSTDNKQGRSDEPFAGAAEVRERMAREQAEVYAHYQEMVDAGVAREIARIDLPLSLYTEFYWQIDLHNLLHFLRLRLDAHAQWEIRAFAERLAECARAVAPMAYEAFEEHKIGAVTFSKTELAALAAMLAGEPVALEERPAKLFAEKLTKLRAAVPAETPEDPTLPSPPIEGDN